MRDFIAQAIKPAYGLYGNPLMYFRILGDCVRHHGYGKCRTDEVRDTWIVEYVGELLVIYRGDTDRGRFPNAISSFKTADRKYIDRDSTIKSPGADTARLGDGRCVLSTEAVARANSTEICLWLRTCLAGVLFNYAAGDLFSPSDSFILPNPCGRAASDLRASPQEDVSGGDIRKIDYIFPESRRNPPGVDARRNGNIDFLLRLPTGRHFAARFVGRREMTTGDVFSRFAIWAGDRRDLLLPVPCFFDGAWPLLSPQLQA